MPNITKEERSQNPEEESTQLFNQECGPQEKDSRCKIIQMLRRKNHQVHKSEHYRQGERYRVELAVVQSPEPDGVKMMRVKRNQDA